MTRPLLPLKVKDHVLTFETLCFLLKLNSKSYQKHILHLAEDGSFREKKNSSSTHKDILYS